MGTSYLWPTFTVYRREKGQRRWERYGTEAYFSRSDAEYAIEYKFQPEWPDQEYEARPISKLVQGFKGESKKTQGLKNRFARSARDAMVLDNLGRCSSSDTAAISRIKQK